MALAIDRLTESDIPAASRVVRRAFGTFLGAPDPDNFWPDRDMIGGRVRAPHVAGFAAKQDGTLVGSNFATRWGSVGFFGPLSVEPSLQNAGIAQALLGPTIAQFDDWGLTHTGLFTFPHSPKHLALYRKYGFYPRYLTPIMSLAPIDRGTAGWHRFGALPSDRRAEALAGCREVTETLYPGLDLRGEIETVTALRLGETVVLDGAQGVEGFAICHFGPDTEAGADTCFVKFGAVRGGAPGLERLIDACQSLAVSVGSGSLVAGCNMARRRAFETMADRGFRTAFLGVHMQKNDDPGYCRDDVFAIDDWR